MKIRPRVMLACILVPGSISATDTEPVVLKFNPPDGVTLIERSERSVVELPIGPPGN